MNNASKQRVKNSRLAGGKSIGLRKSAAKELNSSRCHSGFGPPADLDPLRIWTPCGFGPPADLDPPGPNPLADMDPPPSQIWTPYQNFLLSILCIIFGFLFYLQAFLSMFFSITPQHFLNKGKKKKNRHFVPILPHSL